MTYDPTKLVFTDCETTGLDVRRHDAWEIAWITFNTLENRWVEEVRRLWPPALQDAEPMALSVNQFYERTRPVGEGEQIAWDDPRYVAEELSYALAGKHIVGACPWFDATFYEKLLRANGFQLAWHYHLIDVEALALGSLALQKVPNHDAYVQRDLPLPWKSDWLAKELGLERPAEKERHTALGDAREAKQVFEFIMGTWDGSSKTP